MKKQEIIAALEADPLAVFACKPMQFHVQIVCIRGVRQAGHGYWCYAEVRYGENTEWQASKGSMIHSRDLISVDEAKSILAARKEKTSKVVQEQRQIDALVNRLDRFGVQARRSGQHLVIEDCLALNALLDRFER